LFSDYIENINADGIIIDNLIVKDLSGNIILELSDFSNDEKN
jgi:hypothetical protein